MRAGALINDERLQEEIVRLPDWKSEEWTFYGQAEEAGRALAEGRFDYFVVSDRPFDEAGLSEWIEEAKERQPRMEIVVLLTNRHDARMNERFLQLCLAHGVRYVHPGRSLASVVDGIGECIRGDSEPRQAAPHNQLIVFVGSTPNIGTTLVSFGTAVKLAAETEQSVGFLCLNLKSSKLHRYLGQDEPQATLDALRADLRAQSLTPDRLLQYCGTIREAPRLRVLFGNQIREQAEYFAPEEIEHLLGVARAAFDVCIVEVSAYWDNAATVCCVLRADRRIAVTTQELAHFQEDLQRWLKTVAPMYGIAPTSFDLVVTQLEKSAPFRGIRTKDIRKETQMPVIGEVGRHANVRDYLNEGRLMELLTGSHPLSRELAAVGNTLITVCGFPRIAAPAKRGRIGKWGLGATGSI